MSTKSQLTRAELIDVLVGTEISSIELEGVVGVVRASNKIGQADVNIHVAHSGRVIEAPPTTMLRRLFRELCEQEGFEGFSNQIW